jgi:hypothetical protein
VAGARRFCLRWKLPSTPSIARIKLRNEIMTVSTMHVVTVGLIPAVYVSVTVGSTFVSYRQCTLLLPF